MLVVKLTKAMLLTDFYKGFVSAYNFLLTCLLNNHSIEEDVTVLDIGAGSGTMGIIFKELFPKLTYIAVDLPDVCVLSSTYLASIYPAAKFYFYKGSQLSRDDLNENDFIFLPYFAIDNLPVDVCGIVWNESSMGEMTKEIVDNYFTSMRSIISKNGLFYNCNRYSKKTNFSEYPYKDGDHHLYKGYSDFHLYCSKFQIKRKFRYIPIPVLRYSHPSILMTWIFYLKKT